MIDTARDNQKILLVDEVTTIGRAGSNTIKLTDRKWSRHQCRINRLGQTYKLVNIDSSNGTKVNGFYVREKELQPGDEIQVADVKLIFNVEDAAIAPAATVQDAPDKPLAKDIEPTAPAGLPTATQWQAGSAPGLVEPEPGKVTDFALLMTAIRSVLIMVSALLVGLSLFYLGIQMGWLELKGSLTFEAVCDWGFYGILIGVGLQFIWGMFSLLVLKKKGKNKQPGILKKKK